MLFGTSHTTALSDKSKRQFLFPLLVVLVIAAAFLCSQFVVQLMIIQGSSMEPTFHNYQLVLLKKNPQKYELGDVVAFDCDRLNATLVKRIVAIPGDTVQIINGTLFVNGIVSTVYPQNGAFSNAGILEHKVLLNEHEFFVIGDNIEKSTDSRSELVGPVAKQSILGLVLAG